MSRVVASRRVLAMGCRRKKATRKNEEPTWPERVARREDEGGRTRRMPKEGSKEDAL